MSEDHPFHQEPVNISDEAVLLEQEGKRTKKKNTVLIVWIACGVAVIAVVFGIVLALIFGIKLNHNKNILPSDPYHRAVALLTEYPVIDGHNDLPHQIRSSYQNQVDQVDLTEDGSARPPGDSWHTDIPRLLAGHVGGQFWSAYMGCRTQFNDATRTFMDQIDVIKLFVRKYPTVFQFATSSADIESAHENGRIASLVGVEGGHAIDSSLGTLRQLYDLGARYMTLTHSCNTPWAHSSVDSGDEGLTDFGRKVVHEMNRLGMLVDISHVNSYTMMDVLDTTLAPVIFSHSSSYALCNNPRNVPDNVLEKLKINKGIVMVTFVPSFINCIDPDNATVSQVADHIDHIKEVTGVDHIGIGSDFDGISSVPAGLEDVSKYPALFAELIKRGYSDEDVMKISRLNLIRVFKDVEQASQELGGEFPDNNLISPQPNETCRPDF